MADDREESHEILERQRRTLVELGKAMPGTSLAALGEHVQAAEWPEDLHSAPMIIDTDIGGDADDAFAVAAAARCVPQLALVVTSDETDGQQGNGQRARFARWMLDATGRPDVPVVAGASLGGTRYFVVEGLMPDSVPAQSADVLTAVRRVCHSTSGPVRWVGMGPMTNLAHVIREAPEVAGRLRVTQMGGALRYRKPEAAEHNIRLDVAAAHAVLEAVGAGHLSMPEFIASEVTFTPEIEITAENPLYAQFRDPQAPYWARLLADHLDRWSKQFFPGTMQHDALTLSAALDLPFVDSDAVPIVIDDIGRTTVSVESGVEVRWSLSAEYEPFMTWLSAKLDPRVPPSGESVMRTRSAPVDPRTKRPQPSVRAGSSRPANRR